MGKVIISHANSLNIHKTENFIIALHSEAGTNQINSSRVNWTCRQCEIYLP